MQVVQSVCASAVKFYVWLTLGWMFSNISTECEIEKKIHEKFTHLSQTMMNFKKLYT